MIKKALIMHIGIQLNKTKIMWIDMIAKGRYSKIVI
jgi:hypothetical protein